MKKTTGLGSNREGKSSRGVRFWGPAAVVGAACLLGPAAQPQPNPKAAPRLEPVADTKLLMAGIADPNIKGLGKHLRDRPKEAEAWAFARGQALLVAETGNLLMIRPPKTWETQDTWMARAAELRESAAALAKALDAKDYLQSGPGSPGSPTPATGATRRSRWRPGSTRSTPTE